MDNQIALHDLRATLKLSQAKMASLMGISCRGYEELEAGRSTVKEMHLKAAKYCQ